jgi:hypothetical protein
MHLRVMAVPTPAGTVRHAATARQQGVEMLADDLGSALARERIAELRRQADAARLAHAARRTRRRRRAIAEGPALARRPGSPHTTERSATS